MELIRFDELNKGDTFKLGEEDTPKQVQNISIHRMYGNEHVAEVMYKELGGKSRMVRGKAKPVYKCDK